MQTDLILESSQIVGPELDLVVSTALPGNLFSMSAFGAVFDDPDDWYISDIVLASTSLKGFAGPAIKWPILASDLTRAMAEGRLRFTIQTRMSVEMRVRSHRPGLRFRCVLSGPAHGGRVPLVDHLLPQIAALHPNALKTWNEAGLHPPDGCEVRAWGKNEAQWWPRWGQQPSRDDGLGCVALLVGGVYHFRAVLCRDDSPMGCHWELVSEEPPVDQRARA